MKSKEKSHLGNFLKSPSPKILDLKKRKENDLKGNKVFMNPIYKQSGSPTHGPAFGELRR